MSKIEKELKPQKRLSPTSINTYYKCPRAYFYQYLQKTKQKPSIHLAKGIIIHRALENFFKGYKEDLKGALYKYFEKAWTSQYSYIKDLELTPEGIEQAKQDCRNMINEYWIQTERRIKMYTDMGKAQNEAHAYYFLKPKFRELWLHNEELHLGGYIDRVHEDFDGTLTLGDYKTSNKYGIGLKEEHKRQLALYSLLYVTVKKEFPDYVAIIFLRFGEEYLLEVTPSLLKYARDCHEYVWQKSRSTVIDDYPLKESKLCGWCSFFDICTGHSKWHTKKRQEKLKEIILDGKKKRAEQKIKPEESK